MARHQLLTRRALLAGAAAYAASGLRGASAGRISLGANTAIAGYGLFEAISLLRDLGFPVIEIHAMGVPEPAPGRFPGFQFDRLAADVKRRILQALQPFQEVTAHLPYAGLRYFDAASWQSSAREVEVALEGAAYFGAKVAVVHPIEPTGYTQEEGWRVMLDRFRHWGDLAGKHQVRLAMETGYPRSVHEFVRLVKEVNHPWVGATIDVGHQSRYEELLARVKPEQRATPEGRRAYNDTTLSIIEQLREKVFHLHVHDIDPQTWKEHKPLGTGFVDYPRLISLLRRIGYQGVLMLEIGAPAAEMPRDLKDSKWRLEQYLTA
ncbi:MAG TPA: sugar phosphate isomerase/epimerase family protein [Bryobacteraceae bacterium]|nr:sugar phosphate isomerase/epimerase family protein [Bryobacteraceae bacterium]